MFELVLTLSFVIIVLVAPVRPGWSYQKEPR